jgi:hypothetical protein
MEKKESKTNLFLGIIIIIMLTAVIYLTQKNYNLLVQSNDAVIRTENLVGKYQKVSNDFKNAIIYISTYKNSPSQAYVHTYGKGLWEISFDMLQLKRLVPNQTQIKLDTLTKQINTEEDWLMNVDSTDTQQYDDRDKHIKNITVIQTFFDTEIAGLEHESIADVKAAQASLERLHYWIITLIISASIITILSFLQINKQLGKVKLQNVRLRKIAWIQSHKVRAQVATLLGLGQLFNRDGPKDEDNAVVVDNMIITTQKLDEIVKEIHEMAEV